MSPALIDSMTVMSTIAGATPSRADRAKGPSSGTGSPNGAKSPIALSRATRAMRSASRGGKWNNGLAIVAPELERPDEVRIVKDIPLTDGYRPLKTSLRAPG